MRPVVYLGKIPPHVLSISLTWMRKEHEVEVVVEVVVVVVDDDEIIANGRDERRETDVEMKDIPPIMIQYSC